MASEYRRHIGNGSGCCPFTLLALYLYDGIRIGDLCGEDNRNTSVYT